MSLKETKIHCQNCDNECTVLYSPNDTSIEPMICPFCGDSVDIEEEDDSIINQDDGIDNEDEYEK